MAVEYAQGACDDVRGERHGRWIRLAARRFLDDLKRAAEKRAPFTFDRWHANDACEFIEKLPHVEGQWDTETLVLHPAHVFFVVQLFGFRNKEGHRRFTTALLAIARKNAKSTLAAAILLYCFCCEHEIGAQVISAATTGDQAKIVFGHAKKMVERTSDLREAFSVESFARAIVNWRESSNFRAINAKASTQDGLNPSHVSLDEIHAHKTHDLVNVLESAQGGRANPLWLYTTTEGYETPGPWPELRQFGQRVLEGVFEEEVGDHFLALIFAVDEEIGEKGQKGYRPEDDDFDESKWVKANPLIEVNPHLLRAIRKAAVEAKQMPGRHSEFRIKRLNRQSSTARGWVVFQNWRQGAKPISLDELAAHPCMGGLDLANNRDLCSFRLLWKIGGTYYTWGRRWVPEAALKMRTERGLVPYAAWVERGLLELHEGREVIDHEIIEEAIIEAHSRFKITTLYYDPWNAAQPAQRLKAKGVPMELAVQGPKTYHPAMKEFERAYMEGKLIHGGDPVLNWCASNIVVRRDVNLNMAPDKSKSADKIDDIVALLMAFIGYSKPEENAPTKAWEVVVA